MRSEDFRRGYLKGLKEAYRLVNESNPFTRTKAWQEMDYEQQELVSAYLEVFPRERSLAATVEKAESRYRDTYENWAEWAEDEYENGNIDADLLNEHDCINWERAGEVLHGTDYRMAKNGMVFLED